MNKKILLTLLLAAGFLGQSAYADRPKQTLAEGDYCETPTPTCTETPTPTCTETPTPTCTETPTPSCTETPTPTCSETPTPTPPEECEFYKGTIHTTGKWRQVSGRYSTVNLDEVVKKDDGAAELLCIDEKIDAIKARCKSACEYKGWWIHGYCDDCLAAGMGWAFDLGKEGRCKHWEWLHNLQGVYGGWACTNAEFYFDNDCNLVSNEDFSNLCGNIEAEFILTCPVSLVWEHDYNVNSNQTLSNFKLDPNSNNAWTVWKGSDKAPLLVYDPEHKGVVTDASQLFGNWTFGGKRTASLASAAQNAGKWENGYEALATLDRDNNGKVDGSELDDLALWFDANQNGISEAGEVKSITESGVTALYYKGYAKDALSKDLRLEIGYERNVDGHTVQGASVDWFVETAESKADFVNKLAEDLRAEEAPVLASDVEVAGKFNGHWKWYLTDEALQDKVNDGTFLLINSGNQVKGYNFSNRLLVRSPNNALNSTGSFSRISGATSVKDGQDVLTFTVSSDNIKLENEAVLSADGREMTGTTRATVAKGAEVMSYTWKAVKVD